MLTSSTRHQLLIGLLLAALLILTRSQHLATLHSLPGASWAVFFLAGVYLRPAWAFGLLLALALMLDLSAYLGGGAAACFTPAYPLLLPAYGALWYAGRWYAARHRFAWSSLASLGIAALGGALACELFSSGAFYLFSGLFSEPGLGEFLTRELQYFPGYLQSLGIYLALAAITHAGVVLGRRGDSGGHSLAG